MSGRTALLIHLSQAEAEAIRERARDEHRTVSNYVLNILMRAVAADQQLFARLTHFRDLSTWLSKTSHKSEEEAARTTLLLRCTSEEARRIRAAAKRRDATISGYVVHFLRQRWRSLAGLPNARDLAWRQWRQG